MTCKAVQGPNPTPIFVLFVMDIQPPTTSVRRDPLARAFPSTHKHRRRTATSVCAGGFDEVATRHGGDPTVASLTSLNGLANPPSVQMHERQASSAGVTPAIDANLVIGNDQADKSLSTNPDSDDTGPPPVDSHVLPSHLATVSSPVVAPLTGSALPDSLARALVSDVGGGPASDASMQKRPRAKRVFDVPSIKRKRADLAVAFEAAPTLEHAFASSSRSKSLVRKGWKGWAEIDADTPRPATLIKLDAPPLVLGARTRSGMKSGHAGDGAVHARKGT